MHEDTLTNSFATSYEGNKMSFAMNGYCTMRKHDHPKRSIIVASSKYQLVMLLDKSNPSVQYSEKSWVAFEPAHDDAIELCVLRICSRIELNADDQLADRERNMDLLSELLLEQKRQEEVKFDNPMCGIGLLRLLLRRSFGSLGAANFVLVDRQVRDVRDITHVEELCKMRLDHQWE